MKIKSLLGLITLFLFASACGSSNGNEGSTPNISLPSTALPYLQAAGPNVLPIRVGESAVCGRGGYLNEPCVSVTICVPGTQQCQTVSDILVDTGSVGLRVFSTALPFSLDVQKDSSGHTLAECAQFGVGSDWGPLATADVILGGEPRVTIPIQVISKGFAPPPTECVAADIDPAGAGFNGILGIGPFNEDCGNLCSVSSASHSFFSCGGSCDPVTLANDQQPQNPVSHLPQDNNGVLIAMNQLNLGGSSDVSGVLVLGIGTQANNIPTGVTSYPLNSKGNFTTNFQGIPYPESFIDSGSNGLFFPNSTKITPCSASGNASGFYCPSSIQTFTATNGANQASSGAQISVSFAIGNAESLAQSPNVAFIELGGEASGGFDWGFPFFYGRAVFQGIEGKSSALGNGAFIAY